MQLLLKSFSFLEAVEGGVIQVADEKIESKCASIASLARFLFLSPEISRELTLVWFVMY